MQRGQSKSNKRECISFNVSFIIYVHLAFLTAYMKTWYYALYTSLASVLLLLLVVLLPPAYSVFVWGTAGTGAGKLLPLMFVIWILSLAAFGFNNVFIDKYYISQNLDMHPLRRYLPCVFGAPALFSFIWFVYTFVKDIPFV